MEAGHQGRRHHRELGRLYHAAISEPGCRLAGRVPAGTPKDVIVKVHRETVRVLNMPDVKERMIAAGAEPVGSSPEELARHIKSEAVRWGKIVKALGLKAD